METHTLSILACAYLASAALPNDPPDPVRGPASAYPVAFVMETDTGARDLLIKHAGSPKPLLEPFEPPLQPPYVTPDFRRSSIEQSIENELNITFNLVMDAVASGNDRTPLRYDGQNFVFQPFSGSFEAWGAVYLSVATAVTGNGGWVTSMSGTEEGPGAEFLGYYVEGSSMPADLVGSVFLEQGRFDFAPPYPTVNGKPNIVAADLGIPSILSGNDPILAERSKIYFSITRDCANQINTLVPGAAYNGAMVLSMEWNGTSWVNFNIDKTAAQLELPEDAELDALAVGPPLSAAGLGNIQGNAYLFSHQIGVGTFTSTLPERSQLSVYAVVNGQVPPAIVGEPLTLENGLLPPVFGLVGTDDIDAVCTEDPEAHVRSRFHGWADVTDPNPPVQPLHFSISRAPKALSEENASGTVWQGVLSGWGAASPAQVHVVAVEVELLLTSGWTLLSPVYPVGIRLPVASDPSSPRNTYSFTLPDWPLPVGAQGIRYRALLLDSYPTQNPPRARSHVFAIDP